jgi:hypothetical protein
MSDMPIHSATTGCTRYSCRLSTGISIKPGHSSEPGYNVTMRKALAYSGIIHASLIRPAALAGNL